MFWVEELMAMLISTTGWTIQYVERRTWQDVEFLVRYAKAFPPAHISLADFFVTAGRSRGNSGIGGGAPARTGTAEEFAGLFKSCGGVVN